MPLRKTPISLHCQVCNDTFQTRATNRRKCDVCAVSPKPVGPPCKCGCGEKTAWQGGKGWSEYRQGHLLRVIKPPNAKALDPNWRPWNYGNDARKPYTCAACGIVFKAFYEAKYCTIVCRDKPRRRETRLSVGAGGELYRFARNADDRWQQEHRLVMERHLGRALAKTEVVHHIDENKTNNALENLFLFHCQGCHTSHHKKNRALEYVYRDLHSAASLASKAKRKAKRYCRVCTKEFKPTIGNQNRCHACMADEDAMAPLCACGCGKKPGTGHLWATANLC